MILPKEFFIDSCQYKEYLRENEWSEPVYAEPVLIEHCRIDRGSEYTSTTSGKQLLYNALVFCYPDITKPLPEFKERSILIFDGKEHVITKIISSYEPFRGVLYSYELEVV